MSLASEQAGDALRRLIDRQEIETMIHRYCRAVDRIDPELGRSIFHSDSTADYGDFYQGSGSGAIDAICESHRLFLAHSHQITTLTIEVDGDRAGSEAYHFATLRMTVAGKLMQLSVWGRYLDRWSRQDGRWGIDHRQVALDLNEIREVIPHTPGMTAQRSPTCPSYSILALGG